MGNTTSSSDKRTLSSNPTSRLPGPEESPPAYTPDPSSPVASPEETKSQAGPSRVARSRSYLSKPLRQESWEDALDTLRKYDTVLIVDDSTSMAHQMVKPLESMSHKVLESIFSKIKGTKKEELAEEEERAKQGGREVTTYWAEAGNALASLAEKAGMYDEDGFDMYFLNSNKSCKNLRTSAEVDKIFHEVEPLGPTPIGARLDTLLRDYLYEIETAYQTGGETALQKIKPVNFVVITDGAATDDPKSVILAAAKRLDKQNFPLTQVGIQFVQIGTDPMAKEFLRELDDDLAKGDTRDMVDTTLYQDTLNSDMLIKILLGGINRKIDNPKGKRNTRK